MEGNKQSQNYNTEAFNQGYELRKELGLKPNILEGLASGNNRIKAMKHGMEQYEREIMEKNKSKETIPAFDMDKMDDCSIDIEYQEQEKDRDKDMDIDF